ncbi:hypothetical protein EJD97_021963 [Solanum chilense]|uniref:Uncharacterized protein n=1 Tax=Solanum chilense TaxID=4083 RepID=A0A6N2C7K9_SOLCI|nr:hypothetical protein EJD97_021963 [Solanum chilense]
MVFINLEENLIEDSEYNVVDYVEKQDNDVIDIKQLNLEDVHTGDTVAFIEEIREIDSEQMSRAMYVDGDLYEESIEEDAWEVKVFDKSLVIILDQILEANGENINQIYGEADLEGKISWKAIDDITFETSKDDKQVIEELEIKYDGVSYYSVETSQEIDYNIITNSDEEANINEIYQFYEVASEEVCSTILNIGVPIFYIINVSPDSTTIGNLKERGILGSQRRDNSHGSFDNRKSLSFDKVRGVRKKLPRFLPRRGSMHRLSFSKTSVG